jgi:hypothetical protein
MKNYKSHKFIKFSFKNKPKQVMSSDENILKMCSYETSAYQKSKSLMCFVIFWPLKLPLVFCVFDKSAAILRIRIKALAAGPYLYMGVTNFILYCHCTPYIFHMTIQCYQFAKIKRCRLFFSACSKKISCFNNGC